MPPASSPAQGHCMSLLQPFPQEGCRVAVPGLPHRPAFPQLWLPEQAGELQAQNVTFSKSFSPPSLPPRRGQPWCRGAREAPGVRAKAAPGQDPAGTLRWPQLSSSLQGSISQAVWARSAWPAPSLLGLLPMGGGCSHRPLTVPSALFETSFPSTIVRGAQQL